MGLRTHVVVLCQGSQRRLSGITTPKQLLTLPAHQHSGAPNDTILGRTLMQVAKYLGGVGLTLGNVAERWNDHHVTVVGWPSIAEHFAKNPVRVPFLRRDGKNWVDVAFTPEVVTLPEPGNSSLRGISTYLTLASSTYDEGEDVFDGRMESYGPKRGKRWPDRTVVLLGDVVYSWACLRAIFRGNPSSSDLAFVGTSELTAEGGELWGLQWQRGSSGLVTAALYDALAMTGDAEAEEYQPGQMRHWLWAVDHHLRPESARIKRDWYVPVDDYTMDVDVIENLITLAASSIEAVTDDHENGIRW